MTAYSPIPFDAVAIRNHIEVLHDLAKGQDGIIPLCIFGEDPDSLSEGGKTKVVMHFRVGDVDGMAAAALSYAAHPHANIYAPVSVMRRDLPKGKRGTRQDIVAVLGAVIDSDADAGRPATSPVPAHYVIQSSAVPADNRQEFLFFDRSLSVREADPILAALQRESGADHGTADPDHVWRIAGTANWPNRKKVHERNRPRGPQPVLVVVPFDGTLTSVDEILAACKSGTTDKSDGAERAADDAPPDDVASIMARLGAGVRKLIAAPPLPGEDRSATLASAVCSMIRVGLTDAEIVAVIQAHPNGIGAKHILRHDLAREVERLREKYGQPREDAAIALADFVAYMPSHQYIFKPTREMWPAASVNAQIPPIKKTPASAWLDMNQAVVQMTWAPGEPMEIKDRLVSDGGWIERSGCTIFNLYRPPSLSGIDGDAAPWLDHVRKVFPDDADHIIAWLAHRVQRPQEKINHALVLGGAQGIGKDTLLEPIKTAIGPWNFAEVSPRHMLGRFNGFLKSVILRVSEARDLGDVDRFAFYDHLKTYTAAPPDVLRVDEKNLREYCVFNCTGIIITTNHKSDGIYLPADDRRHFVAWSEATKEGFGPGYWNGLWRWYRDGGDRIVTKYLADYGLLGFDPNAPPPKTPAFWAIVDASRAPEDAELADVLDRLGNPPAITLSSIQNAAHGDFEAWLRDRKNRRIIPHRLEDCGYVAVRNDTRKQGLWVVNHNRQAIYAKASLSLRDQLAAARRLADGH